VNGKRFSKRANIRKIGQAINTGDGPIEGKQFQIGAGCSLANSVDDSLNASPVG